MSSEYLIAATYPFSTSLNFPVVLLKLRQECLHSYTHKALVNTYNMSFICSGIIYHHVKQFSSPSDPTRKRII